MSQFQNQQLLITNMIKRNKAGLTHIVRLPRIPTLLQSALNSQDNTPSESHLPQRTSPHPYPQHKQNSQPKDMRSTTIYLQFPIGKKKCTYESSPHELRCQKLSDDPMFASRAACSIFRRDVRARMHKYDEERTQALTERNGEYGTVAEQLVMRELGKVNNSKSRKDGSREKSYMPRIGRWRVQHDVGEEHDDVSRWEDTRNTSQLQQSGDSLFDQIVYSSKMLKID